MDMSCCDIIRNDIVSGKIFFVGFLRRRKTQHISCRNSEARFPALNRVDSGASIDHDIITLPPAPRS